MLGARSLNGSLFTPARFFVSIWLLCCIVLDSKINRTMVSSKSFLVLGHLAFVLNLFVASSANDDNEPCKNGICPTPSHYSAEGEEDARCSLWLGPSLIKEHEEHGFGLGMFTGKHIKEGEVVDAGLLIPIFDWQSETHPPLREYLWNGNNLPDLSIQSKTGGMYFLPGLGSIAPCTSKNPNLLNTHMHLYEPGNRDSPSAGSYTRHTSHFFIAARDISPGEELTVECTDSEFDGGTYALQKYHQSSETEEIICLDDNWKLRHFADEPLDGVADEPLSAGKGVFAKQAMKKDQVVFSSPVLPISRQDLDIPEEIYKEYNTPTRQLLLNYCFGHPDSDVLLLPYGPMAGYVNHKSKEANVKIQWHTSKSYSTALTKRQEHHHPELLELSHDIVVNVHGKGLMLDYVALRDIEPGEEILLDYGEAWDRKWEEHSLDWKKKRHDTFEFSALEYSNKHDLKILKTPKEQLLHPYPSNIMFICRHSDKWKDPEPDALKQKHNYWGDLDEDKENEYKEDDEEEYQCLTPCTIETRYSEDFYDEETEKWEEVLLYSVKLVEVSGNFDIDYDCLLVPDIEYEYVDVPREAIFVVDRPYTEDQFHEKAFRHEIGVPSELYPDPWLKKKVRRRQLPPTTGEYSNEDFKRKKVTKPLTYKKNVKGY